MKDVKHYQSSLWDAEMVEYVGAKRVAEIMNGKKPIRRGWAVAYRMGTPPGKKISGYVWPSLALTRQVAISNFIQGGVDPTRILPVMESWKEMEKQGFEVVKITLTQGWN